MTDKACNACCATDARPAFALERLREIDPEHLVNDIVKPGPGDGLTPMLTPLELLDRLAALIPPARPHRHRYFGVLAPNSPLRSAVTALAGQRAEAPAAQTPATAAVAPPRSCEHFSRGGTSSTRADPSSGSPLAWAILFARIHEFFPLLCPKCGGELRIIAFINEAMAAREILAYLSEPTSLPPMAPARGPPLYERPDAGQGEYDPQVQPAPDCEFDQPIAW